MKIRFVILALVCVLCGCKSNDAINTREINNMNVYKEDNTVEKIEMTEHEVQLLCAAYSNEKQIKAGELYDYQEKQLIRMRSVERYLKKKYNDIGFVLVRCWATTQDGEGYRFDFKKVDDVENEYTAYVNPVDDNDIRDSYYTALLTKRYDEWLESILSLLLGQKVLASTSFNSYMGKELSGIEDMEVIKQMGETLTRTTYLYISDPENISEIGKKIHTKVKEDNLYGAYLLFAENEVVENATDGITIRNEQKNGRFIKTKILFQTWNEYGEN